MKQSGGASLRKIVLWTAPVLFACAFLVAAFLWNKVAFSNSIYIGEIAVNDTRAPIRVLRDEFAVPHIFADSELDALFGLGFVQAQDRYWQMILSVHAVTGRLSELFGSMALDSDYTYRTYEISRFAQEALDAMSIEDRARVDSFTAGVNAWLESEKFMPPPEFIGVGITPRRWTVLDTVAMDQSSVLSFTFPIQEEIDRARLERELGSRRAAEFFESNTHDSHVALSIDDLRRTMGETMARHQLPRRNTPKSHPVIADPAKHQSNNWVVSGEHTRSGKPMIAGDPHVPIMLPSRWYLARMSYPGHDIAGGFTTAGLGTVIGRNRTLAFSITYYPRDAFDLFYLTLNPENSKQYMTENGPRDFDVREEIFLVNGGETVKQEYLRSHHGPVLPKSFADSSDLYGSGTVFAMSWGPDFGAPESLSALHSNRATTVDEWMLALEKQPRSLDRGMVVAHKDGDIGAILSGNQPRRQRGHDTGGLVPADGGKASNDWLGIYPNALLPRVINPESGIIVTANAKLLPDDYPLTVPSYSAPPGRQTRIRRLLEGNLDHDLSSFRDIQLDSVSGDVARLLPILLTTEPSETLAAEALDYLSRWSGDWRADSPAPAIYITWFEILGEMLAEDELNRPPSSATLHSEVFLQRALSEENADWCDNRMTDNRIETCQETLSESLDQTVRLLTQHYGSDLSKLSLSETFVMSISHISHYSLPIIGSMISREVKPSDGLGVSSGLGAANVATIDFDALPEFRSTKLSGASMRFLMDWDDPDGAQFILPGGQSGHFGSQNYDDQLELWMQGEYLTIPFNSEGFKPTFTLILLPEGPGQSHP